MMHGKIWTSAKFITMLLYHLQDAEKVGESYEVDDLDDEWKELLGQIDVSLLTVSLSSHLSH